MPHVKSRAITDKDPGSFIQETADPFVLKKMHLMLFSGIRGHE